MDSYLLRLQNIAIQSHLAPRNYVTPDDFLGVFPITGLTFFNIVLATLPTTQECSPFWFLPWVKSKAQNLKAGRCTLRAPDHK